MGKKISLRPRADADETELPLAFEALDDLQNGNVYVDQNGDLISRQRLGELLREQKGTRRVARCKLSYRLPSDPVSDPLRETYVNVPIIGRVTPDELARVVNFAARQVYDAIRGKERG